VEWVDEAEISTREEREEERKKKKKTASYLLLRPLLRSSLQ
jgi:hypothetical protein